MWEANSLHLEENACTGLELILPGREAVASFGITTEISGPEPISPCFLGGTMRHGIREKPAWCLCPLSGERVETSVADVSISRGWKSNGGALPLPISILPLDPGTEEGQEEGEGGRFVSQVWLGNGGRPWQGDSDSPPEEGGESAFRVLALCLSPQSNITLVSS